MTSKTPATARDASNGLFMASKKSMPSPATVPLSVRDTILRIFADALDVDVLDINAPLDNYPSIDIMEGIVSAERHFKITETDEDALIKCATLRDLIELLTVTLREEPTA